MPVLHSLFVRVFDGRRIDGLQNVCVCAQTNGHGVCKSIVVAPNKSALPECSDGTDRESRPIGHRQIAVSYMAELAIFVDAVEYFCTVLFMYCEVNVIIMNIHLNRMIRMFYVK